MARPGHTDALLSLNCTPQAAAQTPDLDLSHGEGQQGRLSGRIPNQTVSRQTFRAQKYPLAKLGVVSGLCICRPGMEGMEDMLYGGYPNHVVTESVEGQGRRVTWPCPFLVLTD